MQANQRSWSNSNRMNSYQLFLQLVSRNSTNYHLLDMREVLGLDNAGKLTILVTLKLNKFISNIPTKYMNKMIAVHGLGLSLTSVN